MSLSFHNTFPLERDNLAKILAAASENPSVSNFQIAEKTGIGIGKNPRKGKVQPTLDYAANAGLLNALNFREGRRLQITPIGKTVQSNDPWFKKPTTQWVLHYQLAKLGSEAEAWSFFAHQFLPSHPEFTRTDLEADLSGEFGHKIKLKILNPGVLLNCYLEGGGLERIRLVREQNKRQFVRTQSYIPNAYTVAYILAEIWEARHPGRSMINPATLLEPGHLATTMNLSEAEIASWLDELSSLSLVKQMREAPPYQIAHQWSEKLHLLQKSYDEEG
jgi:hypothetical protein